MVYFNASFYYVRYRILARCYYLMLFKQPFNLKLILLALFFTLIFFLHQFVNVFFRLCDELFFPRYRSLQIVKPMYIIANPRSGTTYMHRLISLDTERFASMKLLHTIFPSVSFIKLAQWINKVDKKINRPVNRLLEKASTVFFKGWEQIHGMGFNQAEEDEAPFTLSFNSAGLFLLFPYLHLFKENWITDYESKKVKNHLMDYYLNCVKRFMYASGKNKTYLSKNVMMSGRFESLLSHQPDAQFIFLARHPYSVLPSFVSMFAVMYRVHSPAMPYNSPAMQAWAHLGISFYLHFFNKRNQVDNKLYSISYDRFIQSPQDVVLEIYSHYGLIPSKEFISKLENEISKHKSYKSGHRYSLEQYGLNKEEIYNQLKPVFDEYGFEK